MVSECNPFMDCTASHKQGVHEPENLIINFGLKPGHFWEFQIPAINGGAIQLILL